MVIEALSPNRIGNSHWVPESKLFKHFPRQTVWAWRTKGCMALGKEGRGWRKIRTKGQPGQERLYWRRHVKMIREVMRRSPDRGLTIGTHPYISLETATADAAIGLSRQRMLRWLGMAKAGKDCPVLAGGRKLRGDLFPFYADRGFRLVWMVHRGDLVEIRANLDAGRVIDPEHGSGMIEAEVKAEFGYGPGLLASWSDPQGDGAPGLGRPLATWIETRIDLRRPKAGRPLLTNKPERAQTHRVWSREELAAVRDHMGMAPTNQNTKARNAAAAAFLKDALKGGRVDAQTITRKARENHVSWECLKYARKSLSVERFFQDGAWHWSLPADKDDRLPKAVAFMKQLLAKGPVASTAAKAQAQAAGITDTFFRQALTALGGRRYRPGWNEPFYCCLPDHTLPGPTTQGNGHEMSAAQNATPVPKGHGGRPASSRKAEVAQFCYERYQAGDKLSLICERARKFGSDAPKEAKRVSELASRYATKHNLPIKRRS